MSVSAKLSGEHLDQVFPFFLAVDAHLQVTSCGPVLKRVCPDLVAGDSLSAHFRIERPQSCGSGIEELVAKQEMPFVLVHLRQPLKLRAQVLIEADRSAAIFLGMPWFTTVKEIRQCGVGIADFPVHTPLADLLFVIQSQQSSLQEARELAARLRRSQQVLARAKEDAEAAAVAKDAFLANISHEIRTPLNGITGVTRLLGETVLDEDQREYADLIERSSKSLLSVLEDVLELARFRSGRPELRTAPFDLCEFLAEIVDMYSGAARAKGIELSLVHKGELPKCIQGDVGRLRQVLNNLLGNAIKFTDQGAVTIEAEVEDQSEQAACTLVLRVTDTGIGIPDELLERVFEAFVQADDSATRRFGGSGLGLAICRRLVTLMAGSITAESGALRGASFRVCIPTRVIEPAEGRAQSESGAREVEPEVDARERRHQGRQGRRATTHATAAERSKPRSLALAAPGTRLLIVEDNQVNQLVAKRLLMKLGYAVDCASDGIEALSSFRGQHYDLVLMDLQMPRMDGLEATRRIRSMGAHGESVPIIALTANALPEHRDRCLADGMDDFVSKPFDFEALAASIAAWIGARGEQQS